MGNGSLLAITYARRAAFLSPQLLEWEERRFCVILVRAFFSLQVEAQNQFSLE